MTRRGWVLVAISTLIIGMSLGVSASAANSSPTRVSESAPLPALSPLQATVIAPPTPVLGTDKRQHLVYEIALLNVTPFTDRIDRVEVLNGSDRSVLATYAGAEAVRRITSNAVETHKPTNVLQASQGGVIWLDVSFRAHAKIPRLLIHKIVSTVMLEPKAKQFTTSGARSVVDSRPPVVLGAPLIGSGYVDANGCCGESPHTRALLTIDGTRYLAQRFAIDWVRIDRQGRSFVGSSTKNKSWLIFGDPIVAAGSGGVVGVLNNLPENTPPTPLANLTAQNALGNHVIENLGGGRYALYAHMQPGSVAVKVGQRIHRGELLGRVGNTGSSTAPHLHFHVTDGPDAVASEGKPYVFDNFRLTAKVLNLDAFARDDDPEPAALGPAAQPQLRRHQLPLTADVVTFSSRSRK